MLSLLDRTIETEALGSVRTCMAHTINSVGKYDAGKAVALLKRLLAKDLRIITAHATRHMLNWAVHDYPDDVSEIIDALLKSGNKGLEANGYFLESLLALLDEGRNRKFVAGFKGNVLRRQMAAYRGAGNVGSHRHGERAAGWLLTLFNDRSAQVRADTVKIEWGEVLDGPTDRSPFVRAYLSAPVFDEQSDHLIRALESRVSQWPYLTFDAVEKVLDLS